MTTGMRLSDEHAATFGACEEVMCRAYEFCLSSKSAPGKETSDAHSAMVAAMRTWVHSYACPPDNNRIISLEAETALYGSACYALGFAWAKQWLTSDFLELARTAILVNEEIRFAASDTAPSD